MTKKVSKVLVTSLIATSVIGAAPRFEVKAVENKAFTGGTVEKPSLLPMPQKVTYEDSVLSITSSVNIKGMDKADKDALNNLLAFLKANNIEVNQTPKENVTTIYIGEQDDQIEGFDAKRNALGLKDANTLKEEGYVLGVDQIDGGVILIEGKDGDGTFYGVQTLKQLIKKDGQTFKAKEVRIEDIPTMKTRGTIEGFYGTPWTMQDRLDQIKYYGQTKMNTYIYAPKDDAYHKGKWRLPYPQDKLAELKQLIDVAKENKVDFVFSLSPGDDLNYNGAKGEEDFKALMEKCDSLYKLGVRHFGIFFDDIRNKEGDKQAAFINRFNKEFIKVKEGCAPLMTVPTEYDTNAMSNGTDFKDYTKDFSKTLDKDVVVLWTGAAVVPEGIDVENAQLVKKAYKNHNLGIWWNYPVTDYIKDKLALGPVYGLDKGLENELDFFVVNPMEHAELSKISIGTGADYAWNTKAYDDERSLVNNIDYLYGELAPYMYTFANHSSRLVAGWASTGRADAPKIQQAMADYIRKVAKEQDASAEKNLLENEFKAMIDASDKLTQSFTQEQLTHCRGNLAKLKALALADQKAMQLFEAVKENNTEKFQQLKEELKAELGNLRKGKRVSELTSLKFVEDAIAFSPIAEANFKASDVFVTPNELITLENTSSIASLEYEWKMPGANIETSTEESPVISYEKEGIYSISLVAKNKKGQDTEIKKEYITVSKEASVTSQTLSQGKSATASGQTAAAESPEKAFDGIQNTKWCDARSKEKWLKVDLGATKTLTDIEISHAEVGGEGSALNTKDYDLQVSNDDQIYTTVASIRGNTKGATKDMLAGVKARYVKLIVINPTQGGDRAARVYEMKVNGLDKEIDSPKIYETNTEVLKKVITNASKITEQELNKASKEVVEEFKAALKNANKVLENKQALRSEVEHASTRLEKAIEKVKNMSGQIVPEPKPEPKPEIKPEQNLESKPELKPDQDSSTDDNESSTPNTGDTTTVLPAIGLLASLMAMLKLSKKIKESE